MDSPLVVVVVSFKLNQPQKQMEILILPVPTLETDVLCSPTPIKEKSICFSSGLKVTDSAAPLNFLNDPEPI